MTIDRSTSLPPRWAESLLRMMLKPEDRESVSGDLLEEYRDSVHPERGPWRADAWYLRQVAGFVWRAAWVWGVLLAASFVGRDTLDWWLAPTNDFYARSIVSTAVAVAVFSGAGLWTAWCSRSVRASALAGAATGAIAAALITLTSLGQLAVRHDAHTMKMIAASGGLDEVFVLPLIVIVPGTLLAIAGGVIGKWAAWSVQQMRRSA